MSVLDDVGTTAMADGYVLVCEQARLVPDRGVAALIDGVAVAVFKLSDGSLYAIDNVDPISGASVLSRGIVGEVDGTATVASPMYKQRFDLCSGRCLDRDDTTVGTHAVKIVDDCVAVKLSRASAS